MPQERYLHSIEIRNIYMRSVTEVNEWLCEVLEIWKSEETITGSDYYLCEFKNVITVLRDTFAGKICLIARNSKQDNFDVINKTAQQTTDAKGKLVLHHFQSQKNLLCYLFLISFHFKL